MGCRSQLVNLLRYGHPVASPGVEIDQVEVSGSRLSVFRRGSGDPVVVLVSALGEPGMHWNPVVARLTVDTEVFTYDRCGTGDSDLLSEPTRSEPRPVSWLADQLDAVLDRAGVPAPYVLAGHSIGGPIIDAYAVRYPSKVAGLVFVDASILTTLSDGLDQQRTTWVDGADPGGFVIDLTASREQFLAHPPVELPNPAVVIGSAMWRWLRVTDADPYKPLTLADMDQRWQRGQLELAERWRGHLVIPHEAGHRVTDEAPQLVASVLDAVVTAVRHDRPLALNQAELIAAGGTVRATYSTDPDADFRIWSPGTRYA